MIARKIPAGRWLILGLLGLSLCLAAFPGRLPASESLRAELTPIATQIKGMLEAKNEKSIALGQIEDFTRPPTKGNPGALLETILKEELEKTKLKIDEDANYVLRGSYVAKTEKDEITMQQVLVVEMSLELYFKNNLEQKLTPTLKAKITDNKDIAKFVGASAPLDPGPGKKKENNDKIKESLDKQKKIDPAGNPKPPTPQGLIEGTKAKLTEKSPFAVEILVAKGEGQPPEPCPLTFDDRGRYQIDLKKGDLFQIKVYNGAPFDVGVEATIDGLDVFHFNEDKKKYTHHIVPRGAKGAPGVAIIPGWFITLNPEQPTYRSFQVTEYGKGAASKEPVKTAGKVGVLQLTFRAASEHPADLPEDDGNSAKGGKNPEQVEIGFGPPIKTQVQDVQRHFGKEREIISIRWSREAKP